MATLTEIVQAKPDLESVSGDPNYLGYWSSLSGSVLQGRVVSYAGEFWQAVELIADVTASTPGDANDSWFKRQDAIFDYAVSQFAGGNPAIVGYIYKNRSIGSIKYFIWPETGQIFLTNGATGAFSSPLDFDPATGVDSGISGSLIMAPSITSYVGGDFIATGSATFTNATNNIALTGVGVGVEIGDVITIAGSPDNSKEFTIEVITDDDNIIVNQAHAGGTTSKSLVSETATVTVKLLCKWYLAPLGSGQGWVDVEANRLESIPYLNETGRTILAEIGVGNGATSGRSLTVGDYTSTVQTSSSNTAVIYATITANTDYQRSTGPITFFRELR